MESAVATLDLRIRAAPGAGSDLRAAAEEFSIEVLRRGDAILERRHPGRVWVARELAMSLRLGDTAFGDAREADAVAVALADSLEQDAMSAGIDSSHVSGEIAVFSGEAAWRAVHLEALAAGTTAGDWRFTALGGSDDEVRELSRGLGGALLCDAVILLERRGTLRQVLAALPQSAIDAVACALGMPSFAELADLARLAVEAPAGGDARLIDLPPVAAEATVWILLVAAFAAEHGYAVDSPGHEAVRRAFVAWRRARDASSEPASEVGDGPVSVPVVSAFGGAFYLLSLALELGVGEALWEACLPEGHLIAEAIALLLSDEGRRDAAPLVCGGISAWNALPDVALEQYDEVSRAIGSRFLDVVRRRGLADLPTPLLRLAGAPPDRCLVATGGGSSLVWFAEPAHTRDEVQGAIDLFFERWSASNPKATAEPALAEFDRRARLQPAWTPSPAPLVALDGPPRMRALVTLIAGTLAHLFAARIGRAGISAPDLAEQYFAIPARVMSASDVIEIVMPADRIDIDVRHAGLDADPAWVPWLHRRVVFTFDEPDSADPVDPVR